MRVWLLLLVLAAPALAQNEGMVVNGPIICNHCLDLTTGAAGDYVANIQAGPGATVTGGGAPGASVTIGFSGAGAAASKTFDVDSQAGATPEARIQAAWTACTTAGGGIVQFGVGTYVLTGEVQLAGANCTLRGLGGFLSIIDGRSVPTPTVTPPFLSTDTLTNVAFEDLGFITPAGSTTVDLFAFFGSYTSRVRFSRCVFDQTAGGVALEFQGARDVVIEDCRFFDDGGFTSTVRSRAALFRRGVQGVWVQRNRLTSLYEGFIFDGGTAGEEPSRDIHLLFNMVEGLWWRQPTRITATGANVTYPTAVTLTDATGGRDFTVATAGATVRVIGTAKQTGTVSRTGGTTQSGTVLVDGSANFLANGVIVGDTIRTADAEATVIKVPSTTTVWHDGWRSRTTLQLVPEPAAGTAYSIYTLILGRVTSRTADTLTIGRWYKWDGSTPTTPSAGTTYELAYDAPNYQFALIEPGVIQGEIIGNHVRGSWSDNIAAHGDDLVVMGNVVWDSQDTGITSQGARNKVMGNDVLHYGGIGIACVTASDGCVVEGNTVKDGPWWNLNDTSAPTLAGIWVRGVANATVVNNVVDRGTASTMKYGILLDDYNANTVAVDRAFLSGNRIIGATTADIRLVDSHVTNLVLGDLRGATISDGGAVGTIWRDGAVIDVRAYGAVADCAAGVGTDNCTAFTNAYNALPANGGTMRFGPGKYCTSCAVKLKSGTIYAGSGMGQVTGTNGGATEIHQLASGSTGYNLMQAAAPSTCSGGGATTCDSAIGVAKGAGCLCQSAADCAGTCTAGTSSHGVVVRDLTLRLFHDYSTAVSFQNVGEGLIEKIGVGSQVNNPTETTGVLFSDTDGAVSAYVNRLRDSHMEAEGTDGLTFGARVLNSANSTIIEGNRFQTNVKVCVQTEAHGTRVRDNNCESFTAAGVKDLGIGTIIEANYFETGGGGVALPRVQLTATSRYARVLWNHFFNGDAAALISRAGSTEPYILNLKGDVTDLSGNYNHFGSVPWYELPTPVPSATAPRTCTSSLGVRGAMYIDSDITTTGVLCRCAPWGGTDKYCPTGCKSDGTVCPELGGGNCAGTTTNCG